MSDIQFYEPQRNLFGEIMDKQMKIVFSQSDGLKEFQQNLKAYFEATDHGQRVNLRKKIGDYVKQTIITTVACGAYQGGSRMSSPGCTGAYCGYREGFFPPPGSQSRRAARTGRA